MFHGQPGRIVSGLRPGDRVLVRRTDFIENPEPVTLAVGGRVVEIPAGTEDFYVISLKQVRVSAGRH